MAHRGGITPWKHPMFAFGTPPISSPIRTVVRSLVGTLLTVMWPLVPLRLVTRHSAAQMMTMHQAKGREFKVVFLTGESKTF